MELEEALLALVEPLRIGEALEGAVLTGASTELGLRLTFEEPEGPRVHVEVFPDAPDRRAAARSARLAFSYRGGASRRGERLATLVAELARSNEARVLETLRADPHEGGVREVRGGRVLERGGDARRPFFTLSPYVGCLIGCRFCYAQDRVGVARAMRGVAPRPWGSYVDARVDAPALLADELAMLPPHPIKLCPIVSDPYHAIEARLGLTRRCLEVLAAAPPRDVFVLTRAALIERDADVLGAIERAHVGFSIPTIDDAVRETFEPRAAAIPERLRVLRAMRARAVRTFAVVQPPLPGDPVALADALADAVDSVSLDVLRGEEGAAPLFDAHPEAREEAWQRERVETLAALLRARGVPTWDGELPPE